MAATDFTVRPYTSADEQQWVYCRLLSFFDTAYFDDVVRTKCCYQNPVVELVAEDDKGTLVGLIDVEYEVAPGAICSPRPGLGGMIWNLGVHPDFRRRGIARALLQQAIAIAQAKGIQRLEAWTRDDPAALAWYRASGFQHIRHYLHVYLNAEEAQNALLPRQPVLKPMQAFAHCYDPAKFDTIRAQFSRVHDCNLLELHLDHPDKDSSS